MATDEKFEQEKERKEGAEMEEMEWDYDLDSESFHEGMRRLAAELDQKGIPYDDVSLFTRFIRRQMRKEREKDEGRN